MKIRCRAAGVLFVPMVSFFAGMIFQALLALQSAPEIDTSPLPLTPVAERGEGIRAIAEGVSPELSSVPAKLEQNDALIDQIKEFEMLFRATDKTSRHGYHWFYGQHLLKYKSKQDLTLLEIGGRRGDSALAFSKYFGPHARIDVVTYGGDGDKIKFDNPTINCTRDNYGSGGADCGQIHMFYCDQSDASKLEMDVVAKRPDGWDIVIDDGSHVPAHNAISFEALWKNVRPGGMYVVEDIETSYYPTTEVYGYKIQAGILADPPLNSLSRFRQYVDVINRGYIGPQGPQFSLFKGDHSIMEIGYARNLIFIRKALSGKDKKGNNYGSYPINMVKSRGYADMTTNDALRIFKEQSKVLDEWRPKK